MASYSIMTVNMNGDGKAIERRDLLSKIIIANAPSLVFCQELSGFFKKEVVGKCKGTCDYNFVFTDNETAVMWNKNDFRREPVDTVDVSFKTRIRDTLVSSQKISRDVSDEIIGRTAVVKLTSKSEACSFLAVSWHGRSKIKLEKKKEVLKALILFLRKICLEKNVFSVIIGGDFNLNTLDENVKNGLGELNVSFPRYELSSRGKLAKERKGPGRPYIAYKDNFAITTISPPVGRPFVDMKLSKVKPLSESNFEDILDHDPIIGVLQFSQTPSAGKFWLSSTWAIS